MFELLSAVKARLRFTDYHPLPISVSRVRLWFGQFDRGDRKLLSKLLDKVIYFSERETRDILVHQNRMMTDVLRKAGLSTKKFVYVSTDDAGSSSPMMLGLLRGEGGLEQRGCKLVDSRDVLKLTEVTNRLEEGAIIYVDDFVGSGDQFCAARDVAMQSVFGNFSEFLLTTCICEEAYTRLLELGISIYAGHIHARAERPLHAGSHHLSADEKERLIELCKKVRPKHELGYKGLATMVVIYRNSPNSIPAVLRGNDKLKPFMGLFPRYNDLPL